MDVIKTLIGWLVGWLEVLKTVCWSVGQLVSWLYIHKTSVGQLVGCLDGWWDVYKTLVGWLVGYTGCN